MKNSEDENRGTAAADCGQSSDGPPPPPKRAATGPPRLDENNKPRNFQKPVAWLLGRQLIRSIKGILLYSAFGGKLDPRDWMTASVHSYAAEGEGKSERELWDEDKKRYPKGFWFDYISDTGDGMRATYSIAYLCLSDLSVRTLDPDKVRAGDPALPIIDRRERAGPDTLPRGEFLFVGGDTAYHASDYITLIERIYNTFTWAYDDLSKDGGLSGAEQPRRIFGIPGNHDYYDQLDGFRRQFRHPPLWEPRPPEYHGGAENELPDSDDDRAQLSLKGFYRTQEASYFALRLPFGWRLWGLDTETGQIDERQKNFFRQFCRMERSRPGLPRPDRVIPPDKLIVATCAPTTAFGKLADAEDFKAADAFGQLGIEQPFLPEDVDGSKRPDGTYDLTRTGDARLRPKQCRLDISGDVHQYARYWGPPPPPCSELPRSPEGGGDEAKADRPISYSYASVVAGIGGAFHHPTQTYYDEVREQSLYPSEKVSTREVSRSIFKFWNIFTGGYVWLAGALLAFLVYFALTVPQSSRQVINNLPHFGLGLATCERVNPTVALAPEEKVVCGPTPTPAPPTDCVEPNCVEPFWYQVTNGGIGSRWLPPAPCDDNEPRYFFGTCRVEMPWDFVLGLLMAIFAAAPLIYAAASQKLYHKRATAESAPGDRPLEQAEAGGSPGTETKPSQLVETEQGNKIKPARRDPEFDGEPGTMLWVLFTAAFLLFFVGMAMVKPYRGHITPFGSSLLVLLTLVWAGSCVALNLRYTEFLFKKAHGDTPVRQRDWALTWVLGLSAVLAGGLGLWSFGRNNLPALLVSDMLFIAAMLGLLGALVYALPFNAGAGLLAKRSGAWVGKLLIGSWHFVLQLVIPFILIRKASWLTLLVVVVVIAVGTFVGEWLLARYMSWPLAIVWVLLGVATIALPLWLVPSAAGAGSALVEPWFVPNAWTGWLGIVPSVAAAVVGAVMCCYWFGWYLGVCFGFNGHNNEVGGAARIERFKQFIRFHLTEEGLTGYVIAVNDPSDTGSELTPHVVDVFRLRPNKSA